MAEAFSSSIVATTKTVSSLSMGRDSTRTVRPWEIGSSSALHRLLQRIAAPHLLSQTVVFFLLPWGLHVLSVISREGASMHASLPQTDLWQAITSKFHVSFL